MKNHVKITREIKIKKEKENQVGKQNEKKCTKSHETASER